MCGVFFKLVVLVNLWLTDLSQRGVIEMSLCPVFIVMVLIIGCSHTEPYTYGPYAWSEAPSNDEEFDTKYQLGVCEVYVKEDGSKVRFVAINQHWPEGVLTYATLMENDGDKFEISHQNSILFDLGRSKDYPEYPFTYERYDVFYATCYKAAKALPEQVQMFLKAYSTEAYLEYRKQREAESNLTTHNFVRRLFIDKKPLA
jgi:hypothetical protein